MALSEQDKKQFSEDGYVIIEDLLSADDLDQVRRRASRILNREAAHISTSQLVSRFSGSRAPVLHKVRDLVRTDEVFRELAGKTCVVDIVEELLGQEALIFRDVLVVKPARDGAPLHYHQDSAYWDVDPPSLISAWIPLDNVTESGGCLRVIKGSHSALVEHVLFLSEHRRLPQPVTRMLRSMASLAGTGDNPNGAGGSHTMDYLKRLVLERSTRFAPALTRLNDFRVDERKIESLRAGEKALPVKSGSVIFFHSLLMHASNPNTSENDRCAAIISYMSKDSRFIGRGEANFMQARIG